jgi:hypothetical protein
MSLPWTLQGTQYIPRGLQTPKYHKKVTPRHQNITKKWSQNSKIERKNIKISIPKSINQSTYQSINQSAAFLFQSKSEFKSIQIPINAAEEFRTALHAQDEELRVFE